MVATLIAVFMMFGSVMLVIAAAPVIIEETTGRSSDAGFVTAVFAAATVFTDLMMPRLLRTRAASWLLAVGIAVIATSAPFFVLAVESESVFMTYMASAVRGVGFALGSVTASLFVINLAPTEQRGRALGAYGVAATVPGIVAVSAGLLLLESAGMRATFGIAAALGLLGAVAAISGRHPRAAGARDTVVETGRILRRTLGIGSVRRPFLVSLIAMVGFGGIISFAPLALPSSGVGSAAVFLLIAGTSRAVSRWMSGALIDRRGATAPLVVGTFVTVAGSVFLIGERGTVPVIIAAVTIGAGLGIVMNAAYVAMLDAAEEGTVGVISVLWNLSIDGGVGLGALVLGVVAAASIDAVFLALPVIVALGLPFAVRAHRSDGGDPAG